MPNPSSGPTTWCSRMKQSLLIVFVFLLASTWAETPCEVCTSASTHAESIIRTYNYTTTDLLSFFDHGCKLVPAELYIICIDSVQAFLGDYISLLVNQSSVTAACQSIGMCNATRGLFDCDVCKVVVINLEDFFLKAHLDTATLVMQLNTVCQVLPVLLQNDCALGVRLITPFIDQMCAGDDPVDVCGGMQLC
eukprot:TRINITY_DN4608_c0_g1_i2.p1 TRINITY_DN4608_c0_g1~~TRINITY_DN4608_c0_g1_i2.p1  ORF type:complete len:193 (-),score=17.13 TRINITY_DN4608_c0_g1_i2:224-802(-)